jgi:hypothetical protein
LASSTSPKRKGRATIFSAVSPSSSMQSFISIARALSNLSSARPSGSRARRPKRIPLPFKKRADAFRAGLAAD